MNKNAVLRCASCGLVAEVLSNRGCTQCAVCCSEPMEVLEAKSADTKVEKHVPFPVEGEKGVVVKVGENTPHPMTEAHYIEWIEIIDGTKVYKEFLTPGMAPEAAFPVKLAHGMILREYCNIHGLWEKVIA
ncbi:MAG: desulfoferrodoxin [Lentisphaeria bacterium]|nr:desulfoferrodoxin [Lentisphaeria bacterium]